MLGVSCSKRSLLIRFVHVDFVIGSHFRERGGEGRFLSHRSADGL